MAKFIVTMPTSIQQENYFKNILQKEIERMYDQSIIDMIENKQRRESQFKMLQNFKEAYKKEGEYVEKQSTEVEEFEELLAEMLDTFRRKNADYGNSVSDTFNDFGLVSYVVRIADKYNRLKTLSKSNNQQVNDESIRDTLMDMANYCILAVKDLDKGDM